MTLDEFFSALLTFPTIVFFVPLLVFLIILLVDLAFNVVESFTADIDFLDLDNIPGAGLFLPPVLSKVPLMVALTVSFFIATIMSFYSYQFLISFIPNTFLFISSIVLIPVIIYPSLFVAALLLTPLAPVFDKNNSFAEMNFIGLKAKVHSSVIDTEWGEIVVYHEGKEFLLDAMIDSGTPIPYGDDVVIVERDLATSRYLVAKNIKK